MVAIEQIQNLKNVQVWTRCKANKNKVFFFQQDKERKGFVKRKKRNKKCGFKFDN